MATAKGLIKLAKEALDAGDFEAALTHCRNAIKKDKNSYMAYVIAGVAAHKRGETNRAVQAYDRAISINASAPAAWTGLIEALGGAENPSEQELERMVSAIDSVLALPNASANKSLRTRKAEATSKLIELNSTYVPSAISSWTQVAESTDSEELRKKARLEAARILCKRADDLEKPGAEAFAGELEILRALLKDVEFVPHDVGELIVAHVDARLKKRKIELVKAVTLLTELCDRCPRCTSAIDLILRTREEDGGDILPWSDYQRLALISAHVKPISSHEVAAFIAKMISDRTDRDALSAVATASCSTRNQTELLATGNSTDDLESLTGLLVRANAHLDVGNDLLARKIASIAISKIDERVRWKLQCMGGVLTSEQRHLRERDGRSFKHMRSAFCLVRGYAFLRLQKADLARVNLEEARSHFPLLAKICLMRLALKTQENPTGAIMEVLDEDEDNPEAKIEMAWRKILDGDNPDLDTLTSAADEAGLRRSSGVGAPDGEGFLSQAVVGDLSRIQATAYLHIGQVLLSKGQDGAQDALVKSASACPDLATPFALLGVYFERKGRKESRWMARAVKCYERAVSIQPSNELAARRLVAIYRDRRDEVSVQHVARAASESDPRAWWASTVVGELSLAAGSFQNAEQTLQLACRYAGRSKRADPAAFFGVTDMMPSESQELEAQRSAWLYLARAYQKTGKLKAAEAALSSARKIPAVTWRQDVVLENELGGVLLRMGHNEAAFASHERARLACEERGDPVPPAVSLGLAEVLFEWALEEWWEGRWMRAVALCGQAQQTFEATAQKMPSHSVWQRAGDAALVRGGFLRELRGDAGPARAAAVTYYSRAVRLRPWDTDAFANLAAACDADGFTSPALGISTALVREKPGLVERWRSLGQILASETKPHMKRTIHTFATAAEIDRGPRQLVSLGAALGAVDPHGPPAHLCAIEAIRTDPTEAGAWLLLGALREAAVGSEPQKLRAVVSAYQQADLLGAGPAAARGQLRALLRLIEVGEATDGDIFLAFGAQSRLSISAGSSALENALRKCRVQRSERAQELSGDHATHMYPDLLSAADTVTDPAVAAG